MQRAEIDALVRAHRGHARTVASLYILRQPALDADDQAFLEAHAGELGTLDLERWWARCDRGRTAAILRQLATMAVEDPSGFRHEILERGWFDPGEEEWAELLDLLRGRAEPSLWTRLAEGRPRRRRSGTPATLGAEAAGGEGGAGQAGVPERLAPLSAPDGLSLDDLLDGGDGDFAALDGGGAAVAPELLEALNQEGVPRKARMELAVEALRAPSLPEEARGWLLRSWLADQLQSRAAWDGHGAEVILALVERRAFGDLMELLSMTWQQAPGSGRGGEGRRGYEGAIQHAFAEALLRAARGSAERGDEAAAMACLSALVCLDPPSRVSPALHAFGRAPGLSQEIMELVAVNERLVKHGRGRDGSLEDVVAAVHALADALG